jgi:hypothetical protein
MGVGQGARSFARGAPFFGRVLIFSHLLEERNYREKEERRWH